MLTVFPATFGSTLQKKYYGDKRYKGCCGVIVCMLCWLKIAMCSGKKDWHAMNGNESQRQKFISKSTNQAHPMEQYPKTFFTGHRLSLTWSIPIFRPLYCIWSHNLFFHVQLSYLAPTSLKAKSLLYRLGCYFYFAFCFDVLNFPLSPIDCLITLTSSYLYAIAHALVSPHSRFSLLVPFIDH